MLRSDYSLLGPFARADVRYYAGGAVLTGHLAGAPVSKVFSEADSDEYVFRVARTLAFDGRWPRVQNPQTGVTLLDLPAVLLPQEACA